MQNIEKRKKEYFKDFIFKRVDCTPSFPKLYSLIVILNVASELMILTDYFTKPSGEKYNLIPIDANVMLYLQISLLLLFFAITGLSVLSNLFKCVWMYYLLFLQVLTPFYVRSCVACFNTALASLCPGDLTLKILNYVVFLVFCSVIIIFKNNIYHPFHNVSHVFAMKQEHISSYLLVFRIIAGIILNHVIFTTTELEVKVILILAFAMFWKSRYAGYNHQTSKMVWDIYFFFICWSYLTLFVAGNINLINDSIDADNHNEQLSFQATALYFWVYTFPFVLSVPFFSNSVVGKNYWKKVFDTNDDHELESSYDKNHIFIMCNQFYHKIQDLKKSQMKFRDPDFKILWGLIQKHNYKCEYTTCPIRQLSEHKNQNNDQFLQQKIFNKSLRNSLEYIRTIHEKLKFKEPNSLEIGIQIAYFDFLAFKNKQKGMLLFNQLNAKKNRGLNKDKQSSSDNFSENSDEALGKKKKKNSHQKQSKFLVRQINNYESYAIFYLKKMIDVSFTGQFKQGQSTVDNQLSQFRQKIEVSVTMLAEFWSLLADPKCNLKKLYDLTNYLFPLKMSLEQDWEKIKTFKNIQSYNLYAKYLIRMFNDKEKGIKIFEEAKKIQFQLKNKHEIEIDEKGGEIVEESGIIFMEYDGKNSGVMYQVNVNAQKMFGYNKGQLQHRKVNDIMPSIYAAQHDRVLDNYQQTNYSTMMNKERYVWARSKNGFIFPITILIKPILSFYSQASKSQVYASIKRQPHIRETIGIIIDKNLLVHEFSSSAIRIFPIFQNWIEINAKNNKANAKKPLDSQRNGLSLLNIREILPDFDLIKHKVMVENQQYELTVQRQINTGKHSEEFFTEESTYNIQINEVKLKTCGSIGFIIKLSKVGNSTYEPQEKTFHKQSNVLGVKDDNEENDEKVGLLSSLIKTNKKKSFLEMENENNSFSREEISENRKIKPKVGFASTQKDQKVKFNLLEKQKSQGQINRKFIFSYDMADKQKIFENSIRQIQTKSTKKMTNSNNEMTNSKKNWKRQSIEMIANLCIINQVDKAELAMMKYIGGNTRSPDILRKYKNDTQSTFKAQLKVSQTVYEENKVDYAIGIKTKRLLDNQVRQMRQQEEQVSYKNIQEDQQKSQQNIGAQNQIRPSELSLILQKSSKNKFIFYLRLITIFLLVLCSIASIVQFSMIRSKQYELYTDMMNAKTLRQISNEITSINYFTNYLCQYPDNGLMTYANLQLKISSLNEYLNNFAFKTNAKIVYSDGSSDQQYLGFTLNKLISAISSLRLSPQGFLNSNDTSTFFIRYNTINGIQKSLEDEESSQWTHYAVLKQAMEKIYITFITIVTSIVALTVFIKNLLLRMVIRKKTQILEIFFEIPRVSCSIIQKQCEKFILRLSTQSQEEEIDLIAAEQELEDVAKTSKKAQKKRSIVGEENTTTLYLFASLFFIFVLLSYQLFMFGVEMSRSANMKTLQAASKQFYDVEYQLFKEVIFMESHSFDRSLPISNNIDQLSVINAQQNSNFKLIQNIRYSYLSIKNILDSQFGIKADKMLYQSICKDDCPAGSVDNTLVVELTEGLNSILSKYFEIIKTNYVHVTEPNSSPLSQSTLVATKYYQSVMKTYWRKLTGIMSDAIKRYFNGGEIFNLWVLVVVCVLNLVILMVAWLKYYWNLQQKINATEYILTFIPIDEINKNKKIAKYIKKEIISRK